MKISKAQAEIIFQKNNSVTDMGGENCEGRTETIPSSNDNYV